ncbi:MAG: hypothetical protein Q4E16_05765 [Neisseria sp.]|nr:hypothetical protein [Neisseria sp.]
MSDCFGLKVSDFVMKTGRDTRRDEQHHPLTMAFHHMETLKIQEHYENAKSEIMLILLFFVKR